MSMIPLYKPYMPSELPNLKDILESGKLAYGKWGRLFEESLGKYIENEYILTMNSFNSAMLVALVALEIGYNDEIIASPMSCLASNQPFITQGVKVVWADIDPKTGTLDPDSVRSKITAKTKAIFHNHHCGYPGYIDEINAIGKERGIFVVDDAIEAFGSEYKGRKMGNLGANITVFSFQTVRLPNSVDGGGLSFSSKKLYDKAKMIRDLGVNRQTFRDSDGEISSKCDITLPGFGATLSDVNSYIGLKQMEQILQLMDIQRNNASKWINNLKKDIEFIDLSDATPNYWVFGILADNKRKTIDEFRDKGYYASGVHLNNNLYSIFDNNKLSGVSEFYARFVALPSGWWFKR